MKNKIYILLLVSIFMSITAIAVDLKIIHQTNTGNLLLKQGSDMKILSNGDIEVTIEDSVDIADELDIASEPEDLTFTNNNGSSFDTTQSAKFNFIAPNSPTVCRYKGNHWGSGKPDGTVINPIDLTPLSTGTLTAGTNKQLYVSCEYVTTTGTTYIVESVKRTITVTQAQGQPDVKLIYGSNNLNQDININTGNSLSFTFSATENPTNCFYRGNDWGNSQTDGTSFPINSTSISTQVFNAVGTYTVSISCKNAVSSTSLGSISNTKTIIVSEPSNAACTGLRAPPAGYTRQDYIPTVGTNTADDKWTDLYSDPRGAGSFPGGSNSGSFRLDKNKYYSFKFNTEAVGTRTWNVDGNGNPTTRPGASFINHFSGDQVGAEPKPSVYEWPSEISFSYSICPGDFSDNPLMENGRTNNKGCSRSNGAYTVISWDYYTGYPETAPLCVLQPGKTYYLNIVNAKTEDNASNTAVVTTQGCSDNIRCQNLISNYNNVDYATFD